MNHNHDKDPFAEYDQFWDELDEVEHEGKKKIEKVDRGESHIDDDIGFNDIKTKYKTQHFEKRRLKSLLGWIIGMIIFANFIFVRGSISFLFIIFIFVIIGKIFKGGKNG